MEPQKQQYDDQQPQKQQEQQQKKMILEELLKQIGDAGRFQIIFVTLIIVMEVCVGWSMLQAAIVSATPDWWCVAPSTLGLDNMTLDNTTFQMCSPSPSPLVNTDDSSNDTQTAAESCVRYYHPAVITIVSEWDLVCEKKYIKAIVNSIQMAGVMVGAVTAGQSSDTVGRRVTCYVTMAELAVALIVAGFSTTWEMYAACRFFVGAGVGSYIVIHFVYAIEFIRHTWRPYLSSFPCWSIGGGLLSLTAWMIPDWHYQNFMCAAYAGVMLLGIFVSPESLRWLAAKGKVEAAEKVVERIARMNGRTKMADTREQLTQLVEEEKSYGGAKHQYAYHLLFMGWNNAFKTTILAFCWASLSLSYYGIVFGVSALSGNLYLNFFVMSMIGVPFSFSSGWLSVRCGRRYACCAYFALASLCGYAILIIDRTVFWEHKALLTNIVAMCSKGCIGAAWMVIQTFTAELYPTVIRSLALGSSNTAARVGGVLAPLLLQMNSAADLVKCYVIVGSLMAVSGVAILLLRETKGKSLADTLHQKQQDLDL